MAQPVPPEIAALQERLRNTKNLSRIARTCKLSLKTLYRTRDGATVPTMATYQAIVACLDALGKQ